MSLYGTKVHFVCADRGMGASVTHLRQNENILSTQQKHDSPCNAREEARGSKENEIFIGKQECTGIKMLDIQLREITE